MGDEGQPKNGDFYWVGTDEPHAARRKLILAKHPEIKDLYGIDNMLWAKILFMVSLQWTLAYFARDWPLWQMAILAYVVGGTTNHCLSLAVHELSHNLGAPKPWMNKLMGFVCNTAQLVPSTITFQRYHLEHHMFQGVEGVDMDIPSKFETWAVPANSMLLKFIWAVCQTLVYSFRPMAVRPKPATKWEIANWVWIIGVWYVAVNTLGWRACGYLLLSDFLGMGLHPCAGHFISEHYVFILGYETYSYYGLLNLFALNVGYHNEHHDFPRVPGSRLPMVRKIAHEFYDDLPQTKSWPGTIYNFITDPTIGPFSRVKRHDKNARVKEHET